MCSSDLYIHYRPQRHGPGYPIWVSAGPSPLAKVLALVDATNHPAFCIAADRWNRREIVKAFGAFETPASFVEFAQSSTVRCFYEIIRADRCCKGYLDLEGAKGALSREDGDRLLQATLDKWFELLEQHWPGCLQQYPQARQALVLDGSRMTDKGLKVSFHVIFPQIVFPCNNADLKAIASALSSSPDLRYQDQQGIERSFVDGGVYSRNRLMRTAMSWKLDDPTCTALSLRQPSTSDEIGRAHV